MSLVPVMNFEGHRRRNDYLAIKFQSNAIVLVVSEANLVRPECKITVFGSGCSNIFLSQCSVAIVPGHLDHSDATHSSPLPRILFLSY
jgi:hypothetical protein